MFEKNITALANLAEWGLFKTTEESRGNLRKFSSTLSRKDCSWALEF